MRDNLNLSIASLGDQDLVPEVADTALDLDAVVEEFFKDRDVKDLVACRLRSVDDELREGTISEWSSLQLGS